MNRRIVAIVVMAMSLFASIGLSMTVPATATTDQQCAPLDSGKIDTPENPDSKEISADPGFVITGYCVKAGSTNQGDGPLYYDVVPPQNTITISYPDKQLSHYSFSQARAATTTAPSFSDTCGPDNEVLTLPTTEGVTYTPTTSGNTITVTATAQEGYVLLGQTVWNFEFSDAACALTQVVAAAPTFSDPCGPGNTNLVLPTTTGVTYTPVTSNGAITVTATAQSGFTLTGQSVFGPFAINDAACSTQTTDETEDDVLGEQATNNNNNNGGNSNAGNEAENNAVENNDNVAVLGQEASAAPAQAVPTVVNAGLAGESTNVAGTAALLALLGAMLGLLALGARAATAAAGRRQA